MSNLDIGILDLLGLSGFTAGRHDKIVRHKSDRYPVQRLLSDGILETYQAYQSKNVFDKTERIVSLYGLEGTRACFFGVFRKVGTRDPKAISNAAHEWEMKW
ncbi:MAG: hypothetical protein ACRD3B_07970, partial [Candidatus Sulfotelmatobacter sp.]